LRTISSDGLFQQKPTFLHRLSTDFFVAFSWFFFFRQLCGKEELYSAEKSFSFFVVRPATYFQFCLASNIYQLSFPPSFNKFLSAGASAINFLLLFFRYLRIDACVSR
jgi:hypothetical protein